MKLHDLRPNPGAHTKKTRVGRGIAAGKGKTAGRGTKGQKARAGGSIPPWFEGGQTPLHIRIPKLRGFRNRGKIVYEVVNLGAINRLVELGELMLRRTHYARKSLGLEAINPGPIVREFAVRVPDLDGLFERARAQGISPGYRLGRDYPEYEDGLLVAITERRTKEQIDRLARLVAGTREGVAA